MTATADRQMELTLPMVPDIEIAAARAVANLAREMGMSSEHVDEMTHAVIEARTPDGGARIVDTEGFEARCLLHELDHLDGVLFLDRVDSLTTDVFRRKRYA